VFDQASGFLSKHRYGKIAAAFWTTWNPVRTRSSKRQVSQFNSGSPDASQHGPDTQTSDMEIACIRLTVWTPIFLVWRCEAFIWKLLAADDSAHPSGCGSQTGKIFSEIFRISFAQLSVQTAYDHRPDGAQFYQARRSFELLAYK